MEISSINEKEIIEKINWAIHVNKMTKSINGDNTHISVNVLQGLLDLYSKEKEKNKKIEDKIKEFKNKFIEDSKNEKVFMTQSSQINASLISFYNELLEE